MKIPPSPFSVRLILPVQQQQSPDRTHELMPTKMPATIISAFPAKLCGRGSRSMLKINKNIDNSRSQTTIHYPEQYTSSICYNTCTHTSTHSIKKRRKKMKELKKNITNQFDHFKWKFTSRQDENGDNLVELVCNDIYFILSLFLNFIVHAQTI